MDDGPPGRIKRLSVGDESGGPPSRLILGGRRMTTAADAAAALDWRVERQPDEVSLSVAAAGVWRFLVRRARTIAAYVVVCLAIGIAATLLTTPVYTGKATLQIDRQSEKVVNSEDQTPIDNLGEEFFQTQYGLLRSRALAARVSDSLGLAQDDSFRDVMTGKPMGYAWPARGDARRDEVINLLQGGLTVSPERGSRLVSIGFTSPDPRISAAVANSFAENFIAAAIDRRYEASSYARDFLQRRLAQLKAKLEDSERDLVAYAGNQQIIQLPNGGQQSSGAEMGPSLPAANLEAFNVALAAAKTDRIKAEQKWRQAQAVQGVGLSEILQSPTFQALSQEHAKLSGQYQEQLRVFKPDYPDMIQLKARIDETARQMDLEAANIRNSLRVQYEAALANEKALNSQVTDLKASVLDLRGRSIRYNILQREVDTNRTLYDGLLQRFKEIGVAGGVSANNISIIDRAEAPRSPSSPRPVLNVLLALLAGVLLGTTIAFLQEALDQKVRAPTDVEDTLGLPLLGALPDLKRGQAPLEALEDSRSHMAEAFQMVRSALQFSTADGLPKTLMVTSPAPGAGKTTTALAVARSVARLGFRVLLIEGDLREPSLRKILPLTGELGLSSLLTGAAVLEETVQATSFPNLFVILAGQTAPNPAELLSGSRLPLLVAEATARFDMVIFDGPPIMNLADAPIIGAAVEGSIMVVQAGKTTNRHVAAAMKRMAMAGAHVLGVVLNRTAPGAMAAGYGYGYGYGYGSAYGYGVAGSGEDRGGGAAALRFARRLVPGGRRGPATAGSPPVEPH